MVSGEPIGSYSGVSECNECGNLSVLLFSLPVIGNSLTITMPRTYCAVSVLSTIYVGLISADTTIWSFRIRHVWFAKMAMSSKKILSGSTWTTPFMQMSLCLSVKLSSVCVTTKQYSLAWTRTKAWLCARISIVSEAWIREQGALLSMSCLCRISMIHCCDYCCPWSPWEMISTVFTSSNSTTQWPGQMPCRNVSQKPAHKMIGAAKELHTKKFTCR